MARAINYRMPQAPIQPSETMDGQQYERLEYMTAPKGMFATIQPQQRDPDAAIIAKNVYINENGKYQIRRPLNRTFYDASITPIGTVNLSSSTGAGTILMFHTTGIKYSIDGGTNWNDATGPALDGGLGGSFVLMNHAMWDYDTLLFTTSAGLGAPEVYALTLSTWTYATIAAAPAAQIMTVFGGRVITSPGNSSHLDWTVKNDDTDWSGIGSGGEDLRLSAGESVDDVVGLFPVNDTQMLIVRTASVWLATLTGDVDAPFDFAFLYKVSNASARSLAYSPEGVYSTGLQGIHLLTVTGPEKISEQIFGGWIAAATQIYNQYQSIGTYSQLRDWYIVCIPFVDTSAFAAYLYETDSLVGLVTDSSEELIADYPLTSPTLALVYNRKARSWTYFSFSLNVNSISVADFRTPAVKGIVLTTSDHQVFVEYRVDQVVPSDGNEELDYNNNAVAVEAQILTTAVGKQDNSTTQAIGKLEVDLMTESVVASARRTIVYIYQSPSGSRELPGDEITYSDKSSSDSAGRVLHNIRKVKSTPKFWQIDLRLSKCATYIINGIYPYIQIGHDSNA